MKIIQKLILLFSMFVIVFGFYQLKHEQDIFAQTKPQCCNNGMCKYENGQGDLCTKISGMFLKSSDCKTEYTLTCRECVDYSALGQVCDDPKSACEDANGNCYGWCKVNGTYQWVVSK